MNASQKSQHGRTSSEKSCNRLFKIIHHYLTLKRSIKIEINFTGSFKITSTNGSKAGLRCSHRNTPKLTGSKSLLLEALTQLTSTQPPRQQNNLRLSPAQDHRFSSTESVTSFCLDTQAYFRTQKATINLSS
jgi:hypothetical protein